MMNRCEDDMHAGDAEANGGAGAGPAGDGEEALCFLGAAAARLQQDDLHRQLGGRGGGSYQAGQHDGGRWGDGSRR